MSVFEFIVQMSNAWAWPAFATGTVVFLRKPLRLAATGMVARVGDIRRLKAPGVDVEFDQKVRELAQATAELDTEQPRVAAGNAAEELELPSETTEQRELKFRQVARVDPRAAIISSFADLESYVRSQFAERYPDAYPRMGFNRMISKLRDDGFIKDNTHSLLSTVNDLRNLAAHDADEEFDEGMALMYVGGITSIMKLVRSDLWMASMPDSNG